MFRPSQIDEMLYDSVRQCMIEQNARLELDVPLLVMINNDPLACQSPAIPSFLPS